MPASELDPRWDGASIPIEHWHFHQRLLERYGIVLARGEFSRMLKQIRAGTVRIIERKPGGETTISIRLREPAERVYVVVRGQRIITALAPTKALNKKRRALQQQSTDDALQTSAASCGPI